MSICNEINIANTIIRKRREKGITQEDLAEYMGVSKAAVSKWEKAQSYPDITLLPQLAAFFNISIDELISYSPQLTREDIRKLCLKLSAGFASMPADEAIAECMEQIRKYYSCFSFIYQMAVLLINHSVSVGEENQKIMLSEARELCKRAVSDSGDALLAKDALNLQCLCSLMLNEPDEVLCLLGATLRYGGLSESDFISQAFELIGNREKAKEISQCGIYGHLFHLVGSVLNYVNLTHEDSYETARTAHERLMALIRLFNVEELDPNSTAKAYITGAVMYCKHDEPGMALDLLEKYADLCVKMLFPLRFSGDSFFTAVESWLNESELGPYAPFDEKMLKRRMIESFEALPSLSVLHDEPRYKQILTRITDFVSE